MTLVSVAAADGLKYAAGMKNEWNGFGGEATETCLSVPDSFPNDEFRILAMCLQSL